MTNPDYPAFRRVLDKMIDPENDLHPACVERAEGPNLYVMSEKLFSMLMEKARAYDEMTGGVADAEDLEDIDALREIMEQQSKA